MKKTDNELLDVVYENTTFEWIFRDADGNDVCIQFMSEDELEQRSR